MYLPPLWIWKKGGANYPATGGKRVMLNSLEINCEHQMDKNALAAEAFVHLHCWYNFCAFFVNENAVVL